MKEPRPPAALPPGLRACTAPGAKSCGERAGAGQARPDRRRMCTTDKPLIVTNCYWRRGSKAAPTFYSHRQHGAEPGPDQSRFQRAPFPVHRPDRAASGREEGAGTGREEAKRERSAAIYSEGVGNGTVGTIRRSGVTGTGPAIEPGAPELRRSARGPNFVPVCTAGKWVSPESAEQRDPRKRKHR